MQQDETDKYLNSKHGFSTINELGKYHFHVCNYVNGLYAAASIWQISPVATVSLICNIQVI